jgi:hypothetical protein
VEGRLTKRTPNVDIVMKHLIDRNLKFSDMELAPSEKENNSVPKTNRETV